MKILLIGNHLKTLNVNKNVWQSLSIKLSEIGYEVLTTSEKLSKIPRLLDMLVTIWTKRHEFEIAQIDVFSGQAFWWAFLSGVLLTIINKRYVLTLHGGNLPKFASNHRDQVSWLLNHAEIVTAPSRYLIDHLIDIRDDIRLIPNAIDTKNYPFLRRDRVRPVLIWLRAFHNIYNPDLAVRVLNDLQKDFPDAKLIMIGPDKGDGSLQRSRDVGKLYNLENSVIFTGIIQKMEVPDWLNKGDIFINTTNFDNTPISVMEAMACGLCVISTNVGGIPYLINNGYDGLLTSPDNPLEMATAIKSLLQNSELSSEISHHARLKIEQMDWKNILPMWDDVFKSLIDENR